MTESLPRAPAPQASRVKATPAARVLALQEGIDLATVRASGPDGAILRADVEAVLQMTSGDREEATGLADVRAAAATMASASRNVPQYHLAHTIDLGAAEGFVAAINAERPDAPPLLIEALFVKAVARAAARHQGINGHYENDLLLPFPAIHPGYAVAMPEGGLAAPAIPDADMLGLDAISGAIRDVAARMESGTITSEEIAAATITVACLGRSGVEEVRGTVLPPQVAFVGFGRPVLRAFAVADGIEVRLAATVTLAADLRVSDIFQGARFLDTVARLLQNPEAL